VLVAEAMPVPLVYGGPPVSGALYVSNPCSSIQPSSNTLER
jgi:hypothetical protein